MITLLKTHFKTIVNDSVTGVLLTSVLRVRIY